MAEAVLTRVNGKHPDYYRRLEPSDADYSTKQMVKFARQNTVKLET
jgi:hypothetical protein